MTDERKAWRQDRVTFYFYNGKPMSHTGHLRYIREVARPEYVKCGTGLYLLSEVSRIVVEF